MGLNVSSMGLVSGMRVVIKPPSRHIIRTIVGSAGNISTRCSCGHVVEPLSLTLSCLATTLSL